MAILGKPCAHIVGVLFYLEDTVQIRTCTRIKCEWVMSSSLKKIEYLSFRDVDFTSARGKKKLDEIVDSPEAATHLQTGEHKMIVKIPDVLSAILNYSDQYVPNSSLHEFLKPLQPLHNQKYFLMGYDEFLNVYESLDVNMSKESAQLVEKETRLQHNSKLWFK